MIRLTAHVTGRVQETGYRARVATIAKAFGLKGFVQNITDGSVKIIAEGEEVDINRFADAVKINNAIIDVTGMHKEYSLASGEYDDFYKLVHEGETDERLDKAAEYLKELIVVAKDGFDRQDLKMDLLLEKQDIMIEKQDIMIEMLEGTIEEVHGVRGDLKSYMESRFERI